MRTIWKYKLSWQPIQNIEVPKNAKFLKVDNQFDYITLWYEVESEEKVTSIPIWIVGTGHEIPEEATKYLGTALVGDYVWHIYTRGPEWINKQT